MFSALSKYNKILIDLINLLIDANVLQVDPWVEGALT
jgi:hypothetical protein